MERNWLASLDRFFFGLADFDSGDAIFGGDDIRRCASQNAGSEVSQFLDEAVFAFAPEGGGNLAGFDDAEGIWGSRQVVIDGGLFEIHGVAHAKAEAGGHGPAAFRMNNGV